MPGPPAADRNMRYTTLKRSTQSRSAQLKSGEEESSPGPDLTKDSSQTTPHPIRHQNSYRRGTQSPIVNLGREDGLGRQVHRYKSTQPASSTWRERFTIPPFRSRALKFQKHSPESSTWGLNCPRPKFHPSAPHSLTKEITPRHCTLRTTDSLAPGP